jgi:hypothetical protein
LDDFSLRVDEKFGKIPRNHLSCAGLGVEQLTVVSQVNEKRVSLLSVDFDFLHNRELDVKVFGDKVFNFLRRTTFLSEKLIAREGQNFKTTVSPSFVSFDHFLVVVTGESSLASNIGNHDESSVPQSLEVERLASDIVDLEVKEALRASGLE